MVSYPAERSAEVDAAAQSHGVPLLSLGRTGGDRLVVDVSTAGEGASIDVALADLYTAWANGLVRSLGL